MGLLNKDSLNLILRFEVGDTTGNYFRKYLSRVTYPGGASGCTWGIGWDAGYNTIETFRSDWGLYLTKDQFERLSEVVGLKGSRAKEACRGLKDIVFKWEDAVEVFNKITVPKFYGLAKKAFPGFEQLHPNCQGALTSIVFNRGNSLVGDSRREMRAIASLTEKKDYAGIAKQIRLMKRLWEGKGLDGLLTRRDAEAKLVESCV